MSARCYESIPREGPHGPIPWGGIMDLSSERTSMTCALRWGDKELSAMKGVTDLSTVEGIWNPSIVRGTSRTCSLRGYLGPIPWKVVTMVPLNNRAMMHKVTHLPLEMKWPAQICQEKVSIKYNILSKLWRRRGMGGRWALRSFILRYSCYLPEKLPLCRPPKAPRLLLGTAILDVSSQQTPFAPTLAAA